MSRLRIATFGAAGFVLLAAASLISVTQAAPRERGQELQEEDGPVFRIGGGVTAPTVVSRIEPRMTDEARDAQYEGPVVLEAIVRSDGTTEVVRVVRALGFGLDQAAIEAVEQWEFEPGTLNGEAVDVSLNVEVNFNPQETPVHTEPAPEPQGGAEGSFRIGRGVTPPTVISQVPPQMTVGAREERVEGTVVLEMIVHSDGTPEVVRVVRGLGFGLDFAAIDALEQWRFEPGTRDGVPVDVSLNVEVNFNLR